MNLFFSAIGQDSHRFEPDASAKPLILGGVVVPGAPGLEGNSDSDVVLHALCNAISGLSGVNILGAHTDKLCKEQGITDSGVYLQDALKTLAGITLAHISISIEARRPHLSGHVNSIRQSIAAKVSLPVARVGLTATSGEGLTAFGRGEGIQAFVIVSAYRSAS